jgi:hypothetical protein
MKIVTVVVFLVVTLSLISASAESPCIECRQAGLRESQKCMAGAKSDADMAGCREQGLKLQGSCEEGVCKLPTFSDQEKRDWALVVDFVKNNADVIREVGNFKHVVSHAWSKGPMPSRYMVYILGGNKATYAVVDVSRSSGETKATLACITLLSLSAERRPLEDACKQ